MGTLYLVATPIGNLEDISLRALRVLKEVDLIACEDTRHTSRLLGRYDIQTPCRSYHKFNEKSRANQLLGMLREGRNIALVSDAGTPLVSDPGYEIVSACRREGIPVIPVPGPSAMLTALAVSGLPCDTFLFAGFLPPKRSLRRQRLEELAPIPATLVLYEAPHRLIASLEDMAAILGPRNATLGRELTKLHEEILHGTLTELLVLMKARERLHGEITLVIDRGQASAGVAPYPDSIRQHLEEEIRKTGLPRNEALKAVARQRGISRKDAYKKLDTELIPEHETPDTNPDE